MKPDIIGVQELYTSQYKDLLPHVKNTFEFYARECEDGELNGIFYRKDRFELIDSHVWYMTTTPNVPSSETLTMVRLKDLKTGKNLVVFNTHLAFSKVDKRDFQARFIAEYLESIATDSPVILTGDLNTFPNRMDLEKLPFYDGDYVHRILTKGALKDAKDVSILGHVGPLSTFSNSSDGVGPFKGTGTPGVFLDHIYVSKNINVIIHAVQPGTVEGHFPSDHLPILIDFIIEE
jgi:endonuclease/exonuclease/phosphatase family metal-dependent hydrolase